MGKASRNKKFGKNRRPDVADRHHFVKDLINPVVVRAARDNVIGILNQGRVLHRTLEIATGSFFLADHLVGRFEAENILPQPLACRESCDPCCHNLVELTPPEALRIGYHISQHFSEWEKDRMLSQVAKNLALAAGKTKAELANLRQDLPCPLLRNHACLVYPIRPLVCRAMHAFSRKDCEAELRSGSLTGSTYYAHRHEIVLSVSAGVLEGCRDVGCQAGILNLPRALHDFFAQEDPVERWLAGEAVFGALKKTQTPGGLGEFGMKLLS